MFAIQSLKTTPKVSVGNFGDSNGGAISVETVQKLIISGSTFKRNIAESQNANAKGGAVWIHSNWDPFSDSYVEISNS